MSNWTGISLTGLYRFRGLLTGTVTVVAATFWAVGTWERNQILSQPFINGSTLWDTTARFHVWPWSFKLAAILDMPAFIGGAILMLPFRMIWRTMPEVLDFVPQGGLTVLLWYSVGSRLDTYSLTARWAALVAFSGVSLAGALMPIGYTGWLLYGVLEWSVAALLPRRSWWRAKDNPSQLA